MGLLLSQVQAESYLSHGGVKHISLFDFWSGIMRLAREETMIRKIFMIRYVFVNNKFSFILYLRPSLLNFWLWLLASSPYFFSGSFQNTSIWVSDSEWLEYYKNNIGIDDGFGAVLNDT